MFNYNVTWKIFEDKDPVDTSFNLVFKLQKEIDISYIKIKGADIENNHDIYINNKKVAQTCRTEKNVSSCIIELKEPMSIEKNQENTLKIENKNKGNLDDYIIFEIELMRESY